MPCLFIFVTILLAGCTEQSEVKEQQTIQKQETVKQDKAGSDLEENSTQDDEKKTKPANEMELNEDEVTWEGKWIFLSDDNLGQLLIEQVDDDTITYLLAGSRMNPVNLSSYGNSLEGTGVIKGNSIELTSSSNPDCGGSFVKNHDVITVSIPNGGCHTPQVYLEGDYKKAESIEIPPLLQIHNGNFQVFGISMGDTPSIVKGLIGNPENEGPDEEEFYEWIQTFDMNHLLISYYSNQVDSISAVVSKDQLETAISDQFNGEKYRGDSESIYLYNPENEQLLIYTPSQEDPTKVNILVTHADGNFHAGVENGWIESQG